MPLRAYILLTVTMVFWGANAIVGKLAVGHISPFLLTSTRWAIALTAAAIFVRPHLARDWPIMKRQLPMLFCFGAIGFAFFNASFYSAARYTTAINIVIIQAGMPLIIFLANFALFRTRVSSGQTAGFLLTLVGILVVASAGSFATLTHLAVNRGDALMLLAIVFYGSYTVALRWKPQIHWLSFMLVLAASAFVTSLPFTLWEWGSGGLIVPDTRGVLIALFAALLPGFIAQAMFIRGTELIGSNRSGLFVNLVPIFGTLMSIAVLGERLHAYNAVALVLVVSGIVLAERRKRPAGEA